MTEQHDHAHQDELAGTDAHAAISIRRHGQHPINLDERSRIQQTFLEAFAECGIVLLAARKAGIHRDTIYDWRQRDPDFASRYATAEADANDLIRAEIRRRGVEGYDEEHLVGGKVIRTHKFSDGMLRFLAQSRMLEFRDKVDVTSAGLSIAPTYDVIANASSDPDTAALAGQLLERLAGYSDPASRPGMDSQQP